MNKLTMQVAKPHRTSLSCKYTVSKKKRNQNFFVVSPIKLGWFWWNLVHRFPIVFASKLCKRFSPYLNNVSTLPCETWNAHCTRATLSCYRKKTPEFIPPQLWISNSPDINPVDNNMWEMLQETVYETCVTAVELSTTLLTSGFLSDDITQL